MSERNLIIEVLRQILNSTIIIRKRIKPVKSPADLLKNDRNLEKLDSLCMQLITIGESIKNLDKISQKSLIKK